MSDSVLSYFSNQMILNYAFYYHRETNWHVLILFMLFLMFLLSHQVKDVIARKRAILTITTLWVTVFVFCLSIQKVARFESKTICSLLFPNNDQAMHLSEKCDYEEGVLTIYIPQQITTQYSISRKRFKTENRIESVSFDLYEDSPIGLLNPIDYVKRHKVEILEVYDRKFKEITEVVEN
jgi:hypothetical protein